MTNGTEWLHTLLRMGAYRSNGKGMKNHQWLVGEALLQQPYSLDKKITWIIIKN
jgi:hypothetical protein